MATDGPILPEGTWDQVIERARSLAPRMVEVFEGIRSADFGATLAFEPIGSDVTLSMDELVALAELVQPALEAADTSSERDDVVATNARWWWRTATRFAVATDRLCRGELNMVAAPNARGALETAVFLSALTKKDLQGEGWAFAEGVEASFIEEFVKTTQSMSGIKGYGAYARGARRLLESVTIDPDAIDWAGRMQAVCREVRHGDELYVTYRLLSHFSHGGFGAGASQIVALMSGARDVLPPAFLLGNALCSVVWASEALDAVLGTEVVASLGEIPGALRLPTLFR